MAFRQPTAVPRIVPVHVPAEASATKPSPQLDNYLDHSEEWVLFSPSRDDAATPTHTTTIERTQTAGLSRISDLGSLDTAARSGRPDASVLEDEGTEDKELDSLDDGLPAFREPSMYRALVRFFLHTTA